MNDRYDPHRAHPDTVRAIILWHLDGGFEGHEGASLGELCADLRTQCRVRTQADVALDIARLVVFGGSRTHGGDELKGGVLLRFEGTPGGAGKLSDLCTEFVRAPTAPVVAPARDYGPTGAAAKESREDIAAPGEATTFIEVTCERCKRTLSQLGVNLGEAEAHYRACRGADQPQEDPTDEPPCPTCRRPMARVAGDYSGWTCVNCNAAGDPEEDHPDACGCEETEALKAEVARLKEQLSALRSRNFDLSTHLSSIRRRARAADVVELFEQIDREP